MGVIRSGLGYRATGVTGDHHQIFRRQMINYQWAFQMAQDMLRYGLNELWLRLLFSALSAVASVRLSVMSIMTSPALLEISRVPNVGF